MFGAAAAAINGSLCPLNTRLCPHLQILCHSPAKQVVILCHSAGGASTCELLRQRMKAEGASEYNFVLQFFLTTLERLA